MIRALGVDIEQISRLKRSMENPRFLERCFTPYEREYIISKANAAQSAAGIFCAKEAFLKAMGVGVGSFSFQDMEVRHEAGGKPYMLLYGRVSQAAGDVDILVSIAHTGDLATAQVLVADR
jgi:holo-[acyl-carrier protein] synthase